MLGSETADCVAGRSFDFTKAKLHTDFSGVQKNGWRLWPLASWVTYQYIPLRLRVLFVNVVAFFWYAFYIPPRLHWLCHCNYCIEDSKIPWPCCLS